MQYGGIAQLGERLNGIQEVIGSIPLISTNEKDALRASFFCPSISAALECHSRDGVGYFPQ